jgi:streptomycin 6-kinase
LLVETAEMKAVVASEPLNASLEALGAVGRRWLADLPGLLAGLAAEWRLSYGRAFDGGNTAYVTEVVRSDGAPAVLKVAIPPGVEGFSPFEQELECLRLAAGDPYVEVIRHDVARCCLLLERLGQPLASMRRSTTRQIGVIANTLARGWRPVRTERLPTGDAKARWLAEFVVREWEGLGRPCLASTVERAASYATARAAAFQPDRAVLVHGDGHPHNLLMAGSQPGQESFRLVDPEGLVSEPAHDLGVSLRNWNAELLPGDTVRRALDRTRLASALTGVAAEPIWQWSFIERVSTGLFLLRLGHGIEARPYLAVADLLADVPSSEA